MAAQEGSWPRTLGMLVTHTSLNAVYQLSTISASDICRLVCRSPAGEGRQPGRPPGAAFSRPSGSAQAHQELRFSPKNPTSGAQQHSADPLQQAHNGAVAPEGAAGDAGAQPASPHLSCGPGMGSSKVGATLRVCCWHGQASRPGSRCPLDTHNGLHVCEQATSAGEPAQATVMAGARSAQGSPTAGGMEMQSQPHNAAPARSDAAGGPQPALTVVMPTGESHLSLLVALCLPFFDRPCFCAMYSAPGTLCSLWKLLAGCLPHASEGRGESQPDACAGSQRASQAAQQQQDPATGSVHAHSNGHAAAAHAAAGGGAQQQQQQQADQRSEGVLSGRGSAGESGPKAVTSPAGTGTPGAEPACIMAVHCTHGWKFH